jgi:hypothetical protein
MAAVSALEPGTARNSAAITRARYRLGNQNVKYRIIPGKKPASATPRMKRRAMKLFGPTVKAIAAATNPQVNMIRAIHRRAPVLARNTLLGTSNRK